MKKPLFSWQTLLYPLALLGLLALVYGRFLGTMGFYWDDWLFAWIRTNLGAEGLVADFSTSRPLRGITEPFFTPLLGLNTTAWQAFSLLARGLAGISFWYFLCQLWPDRKAEAWFAAAIFSLYPGFLQQPLAMTYHYFWGVYIVFFLSLILMVWALRATRLRWLLYGFSVLLSALHLFASEYLAGLEILRPVFILLVLGLNQNVQTPNHEVHNGAQRKETLNLSPVVFLRALCDKKALFIKVILLEIPYLLATAIYLYWRFVLFSKLHSSPTYYPELVENAAEPLSAKIFSLFADMGIAFQWAVFKAWEPTFSAPASQGGWFLLILLAALAVWLWLSRSAEAQKPSMPMLLWVAIGFVGIFLSSLPFIVADLPIRFTYPEDRFAMPFLMTVGMFFAGLVFLIPNKSQARLVGAFLLALAINGQTQNNLSFSHEWQLQKDFLWQLTWRAPALQPGTILLGEDQKTFLYNDYEATWGMVSWTYAPDSRAKDFPFHYISMRPDVMADLSGKPERPVILLYYTPTSCLRILDPLYDRYLPLAPAGVIARPPETVQLPQTLAQNMALSNPSAQIAARPQAAPPAFLGAEPEHGWCYYFQKADLARQLGDWETAAKFGDQAAKHGLAPYDPSEYLPIIEAYTLQWRFPEARKLTRQMLQNQPALRPAACAVWQRAQTNPDFGEVELIAIRGMIEEIGVCPLP